MRREGRPSGSTSRGTPAEGFLSHLRAPAPQHPPCASSRALPVWHSAPTPPCPFRSSRIYFACVRAPNHSGCRAEFFTRNVMENVTKFAAPPNLGDRTPLYTNCPPPRFHTTLCPPLHPLQRDVHSLKHAFTLTLPNVHHSTCPNNHTLLRTCAARVSAAALGFARCRAGHPFHTQHQSSVIVFFFVSSEPPFAFLRTFFGG